MRAWWSGLYRVISSLTLTVILLILLASLLVVGSLLPQGMEKDFYLQTWNPTTYDAVNRWGLLDLFHGPLFLVPVGLLALNLLTCTLKALGRAVGKGALTTYIPAVALHIAVLVMIACFIATSLFSYQGELTLAPGQTAPVLMNHGETKWARLAPHLGLKPPVSRPAPFSIRLVGFRTEYIEKGQKLYVKDWISDLEVWEGGAAVRREQVEVNKPLVYGGHKFYQASFDQTLKFDVGGEERVISLGEPLEVGGTVFSVSPVKGGQVLGADGRRRRVGPYVELRAAPALRKKPPDKRPNPLIKLELGITRPVGGKDVRFVSYEEKSGIVYKRDAAVPPLWGAWILFTVALAYRVYVQGFILGMRKSASRP